MTDDIDRAQAREEEMRADALAEHARRADGQALLPSATVCAVCGEAVPEARRKALPGVQACVDCQGEIERHGFFIRWATRGKGEGKGKTPGSPPFPLLPSPFSLLPSTNHDRLP